MNGEVVKVWPFIEYLIVATVDCNVGPTDSFKSFTGLLVPYFVISSPMILVCLK